MNATMLPVSGEYTYDDVGPTFRILSIGPDKLQHSPFNYRLVDANPIDFSAIKLWLGRCEEKNRHSRDNIQPVDTKENQDFWTIDVRNKKLRRTSMKDRFVALSHVLGNTIVSPFVGTPEEFFALVDHGTSLQAALEKQPRTIADAMSVVLEIGQSLLWVDALCIPPSAKHRAAQIAIMDQIYSSAVVTIVTAYGDRADCELSGVRPGNRELDQLQEQVGPSLTLAVELPKAVNAITKAPWNNQGWTYHERLLSKRLLIFTDPTNFGQCKSLMVGEDLVLPTRDESSIWWQSLKLSRDLVPSGQNTQSTPQLTMHGDELLDDIYIWEYAEMVKEYSKRNLTLDSDMLATFSGLCRGFAWAWKTDLLWGLPENGLDAALLWEKDFLSDRNPHFLRCRPTSVRFPSWTWAGWKGAVQYQPKTFDSSKVEYTRPCVGWFALKNGKLNLLGSASSFQLPQNTIRYAGSQTHQDLDEEMLALKALSVAHQLPTDFCFTNQMLYGYTTGAPIALFIDYSMETTRMRLAKSPRNIGRSNKPRKLRRSIKFSNHKQEITGGAELDGGCLYEPGEIDLILLSERRRIDKFKSTDHGLDYRVMLVKWDSIGRTATRVGLGRVDQRVWWDASPTWREVVLT
jgi:hypothetical protein